MPKNFSSWPEGWPKSLNYPEIPAFEILDQTARRVPNRIALIYHGMELTFQELRELSDRFAAGLVQLKVNPGDRVAVNLTNCPQFAVAYYGILKAGAVFTPVSTLMTPGEIEYQLNDSGAETLITLDTLYPKIKPILDSTGIKQVIVTSLADCLSPILALSSSESKTNPTEAIDLVDLLSRHDPIPPNVTINARQDLAHLAYTGGTTGRSKGVMLTHFNIVATICQVSLWMLGADIEIAEGRINFRYPEGVDPHTDRVMIQDSETALMVGPWYHAMGIMGLNSRIFIGMTSVVLSRFEPTDYLNNLVKYRVTYVTGAPQLYRPLVNHPDFCQYDVSSIKLAASGAAPMPTSLLERLLAVFPGAVVDSYGLTEATQCATVTSPTREGFRPGSVGLPLFDTEMRVVDPASGEPLAPGQEGEICIRGPQVMKGYWNRPEETAEALRDGWLYTGDIGKEDQEGYFYITDRKKDMIIYKGYNVYPHELEEIMFRHPAVDLCAIVGKPDPDGGEIPIAFVQLKTGVEADPQEILDFVNQQVAYYKKVRDIIVTEHIPVSGPGKVLKRVLKERFI